MVKKSEEIVYDYDHFDQNLKLIHQKVQQAAQKKKEGQIKKSIQKRKLDFKEQEDGDKINDIERMSH